jgi:hypothetical protein
VPAIETKRGEDSMRPQWLGVPLHYKGEIFLKIKLLDFESFESK